MTETIEQTQHEEPVIAAFSPMTIEEYEAEQPAPPAPTKKFKGDKTATWVYWSDVDPTTIPIDWVWERLRNQRDALISSCDWRMVTDAPWDTAPWAEYRQVLRDLPDNTPDPRKVVWPAEPSP